VAEQTVEEPPEQEAQQYSQVVLASPEELWQPRPEEALAAYEEKAVGVLVEQEEQQLTRFAEQ
jgi:hypothetical protein